MAKLRNLLSVSVLAALTLGASTAAAQEYPTRTVTIVVPLAAGTGMDIVTRIYGDELAKVLGKPVVIENQPGAALTLAAQNVAKATPDGHTLLVNATMQLSAPHILVKKVNYDVERDFVPIAVYLSSPFVLIVHNGLGTPTLKDFVARAKASSAAPLTFATTGGGGFPHLTMEMIKTELGFPATHVPYRNTGQIITDVVAGHVASSMSETGAALSLIKEGKLTALAISAGTRLPQLPDVPTVAEAADRPGFDVASWHALVAPSGTPRPIVDRLVKEMHRITGDPAFQQRVAQTGLIPRRPMAAEELGAFMQAERKRWTAFVKSLGLEGPP